MSSASARRQSRPAGGPGATGVLLVMLLVGSVASACGGGDRVDRGTFEQRLVRRERIKQEQASCVAERVFAAYRPDEIRQLMEQGYLSGWSANWSAYKEAMVACLFDDDPADDDPPGGPEAVGAGR